MHNLLAQDDRFAFPNAYQVAFPHTFLSTERGGNYKLLRFFMPRKRPMDNMQLDLSVPWEDENATCTATGCSPYMSAIFPKRREHYDRYLPRLREYIASLTGYCKNVFPELPDPMRDRIADRWQRAFSEWGYSKESHDDVGNSSRQDN